MKKKQSEFGPHVELGTVKTVGEIRKALEDFSDQCPIDPIVLSYYNSSVLGRPENGCIHIRG